MNEQKTVEKGTDLLSKLSAAFGAGLHITVKIFLSGAVVLALLIPTSMVMSLIKERESRRNEVIGEISGKWGGAQTLSGPFLAVPSKQKDASGAIVHHFFLPEELKVSGKLNPEVRYRGIFDTVVYSSEIEMDAKFAVPESLADDGRLNFAKAELCLGLGDLKGIAGPVSAEIDGKAVEFNAGMPSRDLVPVGISTKIPEGLLSAASGGTAPAAKFAVSIKMDLNGSMEMNFLPFGKTTDVEVESAWSSPSFSGAYLPMRRDVKESGFSAEWKMLEMNRPYPQQFEGKAFNAADTAFGVKLMIPADIYQQSSRTAKYAALFIVFTFAALFVTEFLTGAKIHIVQYLMTGLAVVLFYSLLLAVSEHVSFGRAYFISAAAVVAMIGLYARGMLGKTVFSLALSAIISILYTYFYVILQMEDYALLTGNIGLFTVLGIMMFATRRINRGAQELAAAGS